jgi:hypothetical protein
MNAASPVVERHLASVSRKRKARVWLGLSLSLATLGVAGVLAMGLAMSAGWIQYRGTAVLLLAGLLLLSFVIWMTTSAVCWVWPAHRRKLVSAIEQREEKLAERLSTLVHLDEQLARPSMIATLASTPEKRSAYEQQQRQEEVTRWFRGRIESQAAAILATNPPRPVAIPWTLWLRAAAFLALSGLTVWYYAAWRPWDQLKSGRGWRARNVPMVMPTAGIEPSIFEIPLPDRTAVETPQVWGEVRITEPGADLRISRLDSVRLQIEAAASEPIAKVRLAISRNGGVEESRELPPPRDPALAVLETEINAAAMQLADGDVVVYFAEAITTMDKTYRSKSFQLEVAPLLADVEQLPGGATGEPLAILEEAADLVAAQSDVLRETRERFAEQSVPATAPSNADANELADREQRLAAAVKALQARADSLRESTEERRESTLDGDDDASAETRRSLERAAQALRDGKGEEAQQAIRDSLGQLVELRKSLERQLGADRSIPPPRSVAERQELLDKLRAEHDRDAAASEAIRQLAADEQQLRDQLSANQPLRYPNLSSRQEQLIVELEQAVRTHEQLEERFPKETQAARGALRQANERLRGASPAAPEQLSEAVRALRELGEAQQAHGENQRLRDAFDLKRMLDEQAQALRDIAADPESKSVEQLEAEAKATQDMVDQLRQLSTQAPLQNDFGEKLRKTLDEKTQKRLEGECQGICRGGSSSERGQSAQAASKTLQSLSEAFEQSLPAPGKPGRGPGPNESFERGLRALESLARSREAAEQNDGPPGNRDASDNSRPQNGQPQKGQPDKGQPQKGQSRNGSPINVQNTDRRTGDGFPGGEASSGMELNGDNGRNGDWKGMKAEDRQRLRREALGRLSAGVYGESGHNERSDAMVRRLREQLAEPTEPADPTEPVDWRLVDSLRESLQSYRREQSVAKPGQQPSAEMTLIAPENLPPTYRQPVRNYFQKLSEPRR